VLFPAAVRVASDTRIGVDETRQEDIELMVPSSGDVRIELVWQSMAPDLAQRLNVPTDETVLAHARLHIDARTPGRAPVAIPVTVGP
jgi:hypothetical protein